MEDKLNKDRKKKKHQLVHDINDRQSFDEDAIVKKSKHKHHDAIVNEEIDPVVDEDNQTIEKKKKKKKKQNNEEQLETVTEEPIQINSIEEISEKKKKNKDKKNKSQINDGNINSTNNEIRNVNDHYVEDPNTTALSEEEVLDFRTKLEIRIYPEEDGSIYKPILDFNCLDSSLQSSCPYIKQYIRTKGFAKPSPIQSQCWPPLLAGRDVIGIASTGSGKTLTFLIPGLLKISFLKGLPSSKNGRSVPQPKILIIAPTRELAMQSFQVIVELNGPKAVCIYGGVSKSAQKNDLNGGAEVVVATPGRLIDLLNENALTLSAVCYLVLDEADRMLDDGFEPEVRKILALCPPAGSGINDRQTVMFSATWPEEIRALAEKFLRKEVVRITVGSTELSANHRVTQIVECLQQHEKDKKLFGLLEKYHKSRSNRILIFVLYKKEAVNLQYTIANKGYKVTSIHGDRSQAERTAALEEFKCGNIPLLIATDVAARGLDIPQVEYVINYTFPLTVEDYVHRIGRTGRGGASGISHTFFTDAEKGLAGSLVAVLQEANQVIPQEIYQYPLITKKKQSKLYGDHGPKPDLFGKKATKITFDA
eukprot:gene9905-13325_t